MFTHNIIFEKLQFYLCSDSMLVKATFLIVLVLIALVSSFVSLPPGTQVTESLNLTFQFIDLLTNNLLNGVFFGAIVASIVFLVKRNRVSAPPRPIPALDPEVEHLLNKDYKVNVDSELTKIKGIGEKRAFDLELAGVTSIADLAKRSPKHLSEKTGIPITQISSWIIEANKTKNKSD
jgi:hypothetical protein